MSSGTKELDYQLLTTNYSLFMPYISVVPVLRTPFGVDVFDYEIADGQTVRVGDLLRVPFRRRPTPALVVAISSTSDFAARAVKLNDLAPVAHLPATVIPLLDRTAARTFSSRATVLNSWLRTVPKKPSALNAKASDATSYKPQATSSHSPDLSILTADRLALVIEHAKHATGRTLIITPWQTRAENLAKHLQATTLHADMPATAAWNAWTTFIAAPQGILIATRLGAWLAGVADTVIIDEPENDDHKQDELTPRFDARWMIDTANEYRPGMRVIRIGTTPPLDNIPNEPAAIPDLHPRVIFDPRQPGSRSAVEGLSGFAVNAAEEAAQDGRPVVILHPIRGERARMRCRDCGWSAECGRCGFGLTRTAGGTLCARCGAHGAAPASCPSCGGTDFGATRIGSDRLSALVRQLPNADTINVVNLADWHRLPLKRLTRLIVTDLSLIGGFAEDIRRRERLVIAWRRMAAAVESADGDLVVSGPENLLQDAANWLTGSGVRATWETELRERKAFGYPPSAHLIKLLVDMTEEAARQFGERLRTLLPSDWNSRGPYPVLYRSKTRGLRFVLHLIPPADIDEVELSRILEPIAKEAIIDLDPIAFFM